MHYAPIIVLDRGIAIDRGNATRTVHANVSPLQQEVALAMQSCLMWNVIFDPMETALFVQVSRSFTMQPYEIFEWDSMFSALMLQASHAGFDLAVSTLVQVMKGKTMGPNLDGKGFVPNYNKASVHFLLLIFMGV